MSVAISYKFTQRDIINGDSHIWEHQQQHKGPNHSRMNLTISSSRSESEREHETSMRVRALNLIMQQVEFFLRFVTFLCIDRRAKKKQIRSRLRYSNKSYYERHDECLIKLHLPISLFFTLLCIVLGFRVSRV